LSASLHIVTVPRRLLTRTEAAYHCGRDTRQFGRECPVQPIRFSNGNLRWDVRDLDRWIDSLKSEALGIDEIVKRLD
jgi:hypothetical protein